MRARKDRVRPSVAPDQPPPIDPARAYVREALEWCTRMSGATRAILWQLDAPTGFVVPIASAGGPRPAQQRSSGDALTWVATEGMSMRIEPVPTWTDAARVFALPLAPGQSGDMVLTFEMVDAIPAQAEQFAGLAISLAAIMSLQTERAALATRHARADELIATLRALPSALDANSLAQQLAFAAHSLAGGDGGAAISIWEGDQGSVLAVDGDAPEVGASFKGVQSETALAARAGATIVRQHGELGILPLVAVGERFRRKPRAMLAVPLKAGGEVVALITAWTQGEISTHTVQDLETLAPYAALQLRQARAFGAMRTLAQRDSLTGMNNRHAFEEHFAAESARYDRYQRPFSLVIFDIDHFKLVNDRYGHEAGDFVLQRTGEAISATLRSVDFAARIGGEEFVVLLPETDLAKAMEIAERIRQHVEGLVVNWRGQIIDVRVSAGVSSIPECVPRTDGLVRSADAALYASKHGGRNRVSAGARSADR